jgi:hypothetical protein
MPSNLKLLNAERQRQKQASDPLRLHTSEDTTGRTAYLLWTGDRATVQGVQALAVLPTSFVGPPAEHAQIEGRACRALLQAASMQHTPWRSEGLQAASAKR